jgi:hypothetical protein
MDNVYFNLFEAGINLSIGAFALTVCFLCHGNKTLKMFRYEMNKYTLRFMYPSHTSYYYYKHSVGIVFLSIYFSSQQN